MLFVCLLQPVVRIYDIPNSTFESDEDDESESDDADDDSDDDEPGACVSSVNLEIVFVRVCNSYLLVGILKFSYRPSL